MVIVNEAEFPEQPLVTGVTRIFAMVAALPELVPVKAGISPVPPAGSPIEGKSFVQFKFGFG